MTRWSNCSSNRLSVSPWTASHCCRIVWAIAGTNDTGLRSRSSQRISANCSGDINFSATQSEILTICYSKVMNVNMTFIFNIFILIQAIFSTRSVINFKFYFKDQQRTLLVPHQEPSKLISKLLSTIIKPTKSGGSDPWNPRAVHLDGRTHK